MFNKWFEEHRTVRGWLAVLGGVLVHLSLGTIYTIGNMSPYFTSYIRELSKPNTVTYATALWVFCVAIMGQGAFMFVGGIMNRKLGPRWTTLIGGLIMSTGIFLSYFTIKLNFYALLLTYGFLFGVGVGIAYSPPLACAMKWLPNHKGLVNGMVVAGFGGGAFIFNQVQTAFINPENKDPDKPLFPGSSEKYFSKEKAGDVLDKVPYCFLLLGGCYVVLQVIGSLLLVDPPEEIMLEESSPLVAEEENEEMDDIEIMPLVMDESVHPLEVIRTRSFWTLWLIFLVNGQGVNFISTLYKAFGQTFIEDDHFLALVGSFSSVFNAAGRIFWGHLADKTSFRVAMLCLCTSMIVWMLTLIATASVGKAMYFVWICAIFWTFSGNFSLLPTATAKSFGPKYVAINYGLVFTSQVVTGPISALLGTSLLQSIHWAGMFGLVSAFSFVGWLLTFSFNKKNALGKDI